MSGLFLVGFFVLFIVFFIISLIDDYNDSEWRFAGVIALILAALWIIAIPISRMDSKTNAEYVRFYRKLSMKTE
jgi:UDP-N-acetylmuramyl pentapeptide phosphotransferase/UDP-N-acetylglucosamine-1-phosphate transferase